MFCICVLVDELAVSDFGCSGITDLLSNQRADSADICISCKSDGTTYDCYMGDFGFAEHCAGNQEDLTKHNMERGAA